VHRIRRTSITLLVVLVVFLSANPFTSIPAHSQQPIALADACAEITQLAAASPYHIGVVVQDLASGERCDVNSHEEFRSASLYKLIILTAAYQQIKDGTFALDEYILIEPRHSIDDPPGARNLETIRRNSAESVRRMIQISSNADSLALRDRLGVATVDGTPSSIGMESTRLGTEFITTPDDITTYFEQLYRYELVSPVSSEAMLQLLLGQEINNLIPGALPVGIPIAHKTGLLSKNLNDAGIVYAAGGDYILTILIKHSSSISNATTLIHQITRIAHQPFSFASIAEPLLSTSTIDSETSPVVDPAILAEPLLSTSTVDSETSPIVDPAILAEPLLSNSGISPAVAPAVLAAMEASRRAIAEGSGSPNLLKNPASTGQPPADNNESTLSFLPGRPLWGTALSTLFFGIFSTLLVMFSYQPMLRWLQVQAYNHGAVNSVTGWRERNPIMRLGSRQSEDQEAILTNSDTFEDGATVIPASTTEVAAQPVIPSPRLDRLTQFFGEQKRLLESIQQEQQQELHPFELLLERQSQTQQQLLANLEVRLQPLNEYADAEEANLDNLATSMKSHGQDFIQSLTSEYLETQRHRVSETRDEIDEQAIALRRYGEEQRKSVELALARFDDDLTALELNLDGQRKLFMRMIADMRSDSFGSIMSFLEAREASVAELAAAGITDYGKLAQTSQSLRDDLDPIISQSVHNQAVLEATITADTKLLTVSSFGPRALPEIAPSADALTKLEAGEQTEKTIGRIS